MGGDQFGSAEGGHDPGDAAQVGAHEQRSTEGLRAGVSTEERARIKELERENRELRRANEILKAAAAFFGAELDRKQKR